VALRLPALLARLLATVAWAVMMSCLSAANSRRSERFGEAG